MAEPRYEMAWDCPRCDTRGLLGLTHRHCPNCGAPQDPTKRYFPKEEDKVAVGDHPFVGVDRVCPACEAPNAAVAVHCTTCGRALQDAKETERKVDAPPAPRALAAAPSRAWIPMVGCGLMGALGLGAAVLVAVFVFWEKDTQVTVTGHQWARTVAVEQFTLVTDQAWQDQLPAGARVLSCSKEQRGTEQVADGQECSTKRVDNGDGTFSEKQDCRAKTRSEPTYAERCRYEVDRWVVVRTEKAEGAALTDGPRWPDARVKAGAGLGAQREGPRTETYTLQLRAADGTAGNCEVPQAAWSKATVGSSWTIEVGVLSGGFDCSAIGK